MNQEEALLVVEDDRDDLYFLREALEKAGVANPIEVATNGEEALSKALDSPPLLILLDLKLPLMTGLEVLEKIRDSPRTRRVPVLMLTASLEPSDMAQAYDLGANAYLEKPAGLNQLIDLMRAIKEFWLVRNQFALPWRGERVKARHREE